MDSDTRCTGRLVLLPPLPQTSLPPPLPRLRPAARPARTVLLLLLAPVGPVLTLRQGPGCAWRDSRRPVRLGPAAARILCEVATGDQRLVVLGDGRRAPRAEQLQSPTGRRAQEETVLLPEILPPH